jgi:hypothetical protein
MYPYTPRLSHAMLTAIICVLLIALGARAQGRVLFALNFGALVFAIMTATVLLMLLVEERVRVIESMTRFAIAFGKLDDEARAALAFQFPTMRYRIRRGQPRQMFEDTNVSIETFRIFLQTSNRKYISPERDWNSHQMPRDDWTEIRDWLQANDYIVPDSASGSHSWLWAGNSYDHLMAYWLAGRTIPDLNERETA